jgi:tetratricopeptide (TPR) repeat protein
VRLLLAQALGESGQSRAAIACYRECLATQPDLVEALNGLAWFLATDPDPAVRRGPEAVTLAERANQLVKSADPGVLDTLAAALAEVGEFDRALEHARQARVLAERLAAHALVAELDDRIELYAKHTPYHSARDTSSAASKPS